jgi:hypothetical protein
MHVESPAERNGSILKELSSEPLACGLPSDRARVGRQRACGARKVSDALLRDVARFRHASAEADIVWRYIV